MTITHLHPVVADDTAVRLVQFAADVTRGNDTLDAALSLVQDILGRASDTEMRLADGNTGPTGDLLRNRASRLNALLVETIKFQFDLSGGRA
jgi:hypothetical protein